jgi:hypothetical protein
LVLSIPVAGTCTPLAAATVLVSPSEYPDFTTHLCTFPRRRFTSSHFVWKMQLTQSHEAENAAGHTHNVLIVCISCHLEALSLALGRSVVGDDDSIIFNPISLCDRVCARDFVTLCEVDSTHR